MLVMRPTASPVRVSINWRIAMVLVPNDFVMGINFSSDFQSRPVDPADAAKQLTPLVGMAKTFSLSQSSKNFMDQATKRLLRLAVGAPNDMLHDFANNKTGLSMPFGRMPTISAGYVLGTSRSGHGTTALTKKSWLQRLKTYSRRCELQV
jgi:hypothetical protein